MNNSKLLNTAVVVSALGYFVDIYDLVLFSIVRVASLRSLLVPEEQILTVGVQLLNAQMIGMLIGGILWGIIGDKKGRVAVLFGSIFLYSIANILNAYVSTVQQYAILRFIAGIGLAGELGAAITLVSEVMTKESRGFGTTIVASVGICGAVLAGIIGDLYSWQTAYLIGGGLGLALLALRMSTFESTLFTSLKSNKVSRGNFFLLFNNRERFKRYICTVLIGLPIWYVIGVLITFSPELSRALNVSGDIQAGRSILFCYLGLAIGDLSSGLISQYLKSRKKSVFIYMLLTLFGVILYVNAYEISAVNFYALCIFLGFSTGYWAVFVTIAAEQFGTNLRATVATTSPNFIRGAVVPITLSFQYLTNSLHLSLLNSALTVGLISIFISFLALSQLKETYGKELDFIEN